MWATILSLVFGVASKAVLGYFSSQKHEDGMHRLMTTNTEYRRIELMQKQYDHVDWSARITRIFIVLPIVWVFLGLCVYIIGWNPDLSYTIQTERIMSPFWAFFSPFPMSKQGVLTINGVFVMERLWCAVFFIIGFFLNKFGK